MGFQMSLYFSPRNRGSAEKAMDCEEKTIGEMIKNGCRFANKTTVEWAFPML
jgi:hypothetical protein